MWPPWVKTTRSSADAVAETGITCRSPSFASPTLRDLQALLHDDPAHLPSSSPSLRRILHRARLASSALRAIRSTVSSPDRHPRHGVSVILYFTSLRIVRGTFEDCRAVRAILRGLRVAVDERDVSMDSRFLAELQTARGCRQPVLPQVFLAGRCLGGADEIRRLHESGQLKALIEGAAPAAGSACECCNGLRFVLCVACSGSHKRYSDKCGGFRSCGECNENGLVRCPDCCALPI
ncbi:hypothetical protein Cni_G25391 [Canna indica]|uniref:Glutaredoxin domain-containing protein n=1 Tax=Canna indica TaxID=4628 RepID=A0AAQ3QP76_9LILI|nr:hypothetical protein Cni_G25391 [Canna indica]